jgi:hypothetical protein
MGGVAGSAAAGVAGGRGSGSRKGVVVMLLAEGLEILGEKGTKVWHSKWQYLLQAQ